MQQVTQAIYIRTDWNGNTICRVWYFSITVAEALCNWNLYGLLIKLDT